METSFRQISLFPFLQVGDPGYEGELTFDVPRNAVGVYKTAVRALMIAELELLKEVEHELRELKDTVPSPRDRLARNRRTRAIQLLDRLNDLKGQMEE